MIASLLSLLPALLALAAWQDGEAHPVVSRVVIRDEVILRVPVRPRLVPPAVEWEEHKGPRCIPAAEIRGASLAGSEHVDFLLADRSRVRARFDEDCPALDFYAGFYLKPEDEQLCADRDYVHSRVGSSCRIERFRKLTARFKR